ncbi:MULTISPECIES: AzlD domain-containing protein [unclassified Halomonas]|uniref:AzlD domain-containing protein n=1 Tax=unclassified Halomonas TaxID=2609666 RepID=UPI0021E46DBE|nr:MULTISPECIES: AzlD domain-containing protein [unclassified Halomonas]UYF99004.1 AzlD domain-containing protein [Halomonas sp. GD1P12]WNL43186.1 AzlD domain-containing protein [Halomonas sp. PAMB 3264]
MSVELWIAVAMSALGTLLIRVAPFLWMQRRLDQRDGPSPLPGWLATLGPLMIAAVLGVSIVPVNPGTTSWVATALGLLTTCLVWRRTRSLGWPVAAGVTVFGVVVILAALALPG